MTYSPLSTIFQPRRRKTSFKGNHPKTPQDGINHRLVDFSFWVGEHQCDDDIAVVGVGKVGRFLAMDHPGGIDEAFHVEHVFLWIDVHILQVLFVQSQTTRIHTAIGYQFHPSPVTADPVTIFGWRIHCHKRRIGQFKAEPFVVIRDVAYLFGLASSQSQCILRGFGRELSWLQPSQSAELRRGEKGIPYGRLEMVIGTSITTSN